jgi:hypothetical protein
MVSSGFHREVQHDRPHYETGEQCCLLADDSRAQRRALRVAAPSIVRSTRVCGLRLDQPIGYQSGEGPVQRAWAEPPASGYELVYKPMTAYPWLPDANASKTWKPAVLRAGEALVELTFRHDTVHFGYYRSRYIRFAYPPDFRK